MNVKTLYAALIAMPMLLGATAESFAWSKTGFAGTRDQVRAGCAKAGGELIEGQKETHCFGTKAGTSVSCYDDGTCDGSGPGPMPRVRIGMLDLGAVLGLKAKAQPQPVPESLTSGNGGGSAPSQSAGSGPSYGDIGQWHAQPSGGPIFYAN